MTGGIVLIGMFAETKSHAVDLFKEQGIVPADVVNYFAHGTQGATHSVESSDLRQKHRGVIGAVAGVLRQL